MTLRIYYIPSRSQFGHKTPFKCENLWLFFNFFLFHGRLPVLCRRFPGLKPTFARIPIHQAAAFFLLEVSVMKSSDFFVLEFFLTVDSSSRARVLRQLADTWLRIAVRRGEV